MVLAPLIFTAGRARLDCFSKNHFKNRLFRLLCMLGIPRMAAKLRPAGRQTTPPGRAGEFPACGAVKQHNFLTGFRGKQFSQAPPSHPPAVRARGLEPWTRQMPIRKASELGGSNTNYENKRMTLFYYLPSLRICSALRRQSHPGTLQSLRWGWCLLVHALAWPKT